MSLRNIPLRKLMKIMLLDAKHRISAIRKDIITDRARAQASPDSDGGGDFYVPFWADAKAHVFGQDNIHKMVKKRIAKSKYRKRLYPLLRDGFLMWWDDEHTWKEPLKAGPPLTAQHELPGLAAVIRVDNVLSLEDAKGDRWYIYPYFAEEPAFTEKSARFALWVLQKILPNNIQLEQIQILDVFRGHAFSTDNTPLSGNEEASFLKEYESLLKQSNDLSQE